MKIKNHFDSVAKDYDKNRSKGFLGNIVDRERLVVLEFLNASENEMILDAGCGSGYYSLLLKKKKAMPVGVDISPEMINSLKRNGIQGYVSDLAEMNLGKKFDKALCVGALEFVDSPSNVINNLSRHIKKQGILVLLYPRKSFGGFLYFIYHLIFHGIRIKLFSKKQIIKMLEKSSFRAVENKSLDLITSVVKAETF